MLSFSVVLQFHVFLDQDVKPALELKNRLRVAMGEEANSDAETVDMDYMSDEAIENLNTMFGQVFKQMSGKLKD